EATTPWSLVKRNEAATAGHMSLLNPAKELGKRRRVQIGIGIDEQEPVTLRHACAGVAGTRDLVDRLEDHRGSCRASESSGAVGGVVIHDNDFRRAILAGVRAQ